MRHWVKVMAATLIAATALETRAQEPEILTIPRVAAVPVIDGRLAEDFYRTLPFVPFVSEVKHSGKMDIAIVAGKASGLGANAAGNRFTLFHTEQGLYITIVSMLEPDEQLTVSCEMPDGLFEFFRRDDMMEVLIDPMANGHDYYWFLTNPGGNRTDLCAQADPDRSWNGIWQSASTVEDNTWTMEMFLPFATFNRLPLQTEFGLNLARFQPEGFKRQIWGGEYRMPATWQRCRLEDFAPRSTCELTAMEIKDENHPGHGRLQAVVQPHPDVATAKLTATWQIMRPLQARGWQPEGNGPRRTVPATVQLQEDGTLRFDAEIAIDDDEPVIAALALYDASGELLWLSADRAIGKQHRIGGPGSEFSYYTTEPEARFALEPASEVVADRLRAQLIAPDGTTVWEQDFPAHAPRIEFVLETASLPLGDSKLQTTLFRDGQEIAARAFPVRRLAPNPEIEEVKVSHFERAVHVGGKAFPIFGNSPQISDFGLDFGRARMREMAEHGFNTMHVWGGYYTIDDNGIRIEPEKLDAIFDMAEANGLKVILYMGEWVGHAPHSPFVKGKLSDDERIALVREVVLQIRNRKGLLAYEPYDEPEFFVAPEYLERIHAEIKALDPYHLVTINNCRGSRAVLQFLRATDVVSIDYYPIGKWPADTVVPITDDLVAFAGNKPVRWWIQGYQIFNPAAPTPEELKGMTYMVWAHGTSAIFYFIGRPEEPLWQAQGECAEVNRVAADALTAPYRRVLPVAPRNSKVFASLREKGNRAWIIAVNESPGEQQAAIALPEELAARTTAAVDVMTGEKIAIRDHALKSTFSAWAGKIIELELSQNGRKEFGK